MPREGHGSRNYESKPEYYSRRVMPREGHGSRNEGCQKSSLVHKRSCPARGMGVEMVLGRPGTLGRICVMPREGHGSRNYIK